MNGTLKMGIYLWRVHAAASTAAVLVRARPELYEASNSSIDRLQTHLPSDGACRPMVGATSGPGSRSERPKASWSDEVSPQRGKDLASLGIPDRCQPSAGLTRCGWFKGSMPSVAWRARRGVVGGPRRPTRAGGDRRGRTFLVEWSENGPLGPKITNQAAARGPLSTRANGRPDGIALIAGPAHDDQHARRLGQAVSLAPKYVADSIDI